MASLFMKTKQNRMLMFLERPFLIQCYASIMQITLDTILRLRLGLSGKNSADLINIII